MKHGPHYICCCLLLLALLSGCVSYKSEPLLPEASAAEFESRSLDAAGLMQFIRTNEPVSSGGGPIDTWDLERLTLAAFYYHPDLDLARARRNVTEAEIVSAGARPNPTVSASPEYTFNAQGVSPWLAGLNFDIPMETAGKRGHRISKSQHLAEAARLNIASKAWQVRSGVRANLVEYAGASRRLQLAREQERMQKELVAALDQQLKAGLIAPLDVSPARIALTRFQLESGTAQSQLIESRARLANSIGIPAKALDNAKLSSPLLQKPAAALPSEEMRSRALRNRPDVLVALSEYAAAQSALQGEIAKQYPDLHLGTGYQYDQGEHKWALVGLSLELPVLNRNQGGIAEATARRKEAAVQFLALQAKIIGDLSEAEAAYAAANEQFMKAEAVLSAQQQQYNNVMAQFKVGEIDRSQLLLAEQEKASLQSFRLESEIKAEQALGKIEDAMQTPIPSWNWTSIEQGRESLKQK